MIATGHIHLEVSGDREAALLLLPLARQHLGELRALFGVDERIAAGEIGGLFHRTYDLEDGSTIQVVTNNGTDTVRITVPEKPSSVVALVAPEARGDASQSPQVEVPEIEEEIIAVGYFRGEGHKAVRWSSKTGLSTLISGSSSCVAFCISEDGRVTGGQVQNDDGGRAFFVIDDVVSVLPQLPVMSLPFSGGYNGDSVYACSGDGALIAGESQFQVVRWETGAPIRYVTEATRAALGDMGIRAMEDSGAAYGFSGQPTGVPFTFIFVAARFPGGDVVQYLDPISGTDFSIVWGASKNGKYQVGTSEIGGLGFATLWTDGVAELLIPPWYTGVGYSEAFGVSEDGVVGGYAGDFSFRWTRETGFEAIEIPFVLGVSPDGSALACDVNGVWTTEKGFLDEDSYPDAPGVTQINAVAITVV